MSLNCVLKMAYKVIFCYVYFTTIFKCKVEILVGTETFEYSDIKKKKLIIHNLLLSRLSVTCFWSYICVVCECVCVCF